LSFKLFCQQWLIPATELLKMPPVRLIIVPGWRDSGPGHWQSLWAEQLPGAVRVQQDDWITPKRAAWVDAIARTILAQDGPVVVVAHSLGCIATAHLPPEAAARIQGALLVAPADPERLAALSDFAPVPFQKLPYRHLLVASSNDPYCPARLAGGVAFAPFAHPEFSISTPLFGALTA
jgi:predicted alpha/beta hydrolase family esterase